MTTPSQPSPSPQLQKTHPYTILLATPSTPTPTFLSDLQSSDIDPVFAGQGIRFLRKENPTGGDWSHVFVVPGTFLPYQLEGGFQLWQRWSFGVDAGRKFVFGEGDVGGKGVVKMGEGFEKSVDLKEAVRYWWREGDARVWVLGFKTFEWEGEREAYVEYLSHLQTRSSEKYNVTVHLSGPVTVNNALVSCEPRKQDADAGDFFTLMSFSSDEQFAAFLEDEGARALREELGVKGREGMVLTQRLRLPKKGVGIDRMGW